MNLPLKFLLGLTLSLVLFAGEAVDRRNQPFTIKKEQKIPDSKQDKIFKKAKRWLKAEPNVKILRYNEQKGVIEAQGILLYVNDVKIEDVFLSPDAALRTKGTIMFLIKIQCEDNKYSMEFTDFNHEAFESRYGKISFGLIVQNDKVPLGKCFEHTVWCNAVWQNMREKIRRKAAALYISSKESIK